jgi:hypothetical protein
MVAVLTLHYLSPEKESKPMKRNHLAIAIMALLAATLLAVAGCKSMGMAATSKGQLLKINIYAPTNLPEGGEDNIDIVTSNRGVNNLQDVLLDVELPSQVIVLDQTADRGVDTVTAPGSNTYHFAIGKLQPGDDTHLRFKVRTAFGAGNEATVNVTAWQKDLPSERLVRKAVIGLRK